MKNSSVAYYLGQASSYVFLFVGFFLVVYWDSEAVRQSTIVTCFIILSVLVERWSRQFKDIEKREV